LRPTFSTYVHDRWELAPISLGLLLLGGPDRDAAAAKEQNGPPGFGPPPGGFPPPSGEGRNGPPARFGPPGGFAPPPGGFPPPEGPWNRHPGGFGPPPGFGGPEANETPRAPRGSSAFIYVDPKSGKVELFDYISAAPRGRQRGFVLHFHKDRPLNGMTAASLFFEGNERSLLVEALSYDVYRRAGNAAPLTEFLRLWVDGQMVGYQLLVERPNKSFLRRHEVNTQGNLYKLRWFGQGVVGQHKKLTHTQTGHDDLLAIIDLLAKTQSKPDEQWAVIQEHFDVDQVATHFAVNMILAHWDGFFNNYYTYHDTKKGKWLMYPWDHDQTWGMAMGSEQLLVDLPLTFGMQGAVAPGAAQRPNAPAGPGFGPFGGGGPMWWRPPGYFSGPLLANPQFRKVFLARLRQILDKVYTEQNYFPVIDDMAAQLGDDVALFAQTRGEDADSGKRQLSENTNLVKSFLRQRRAYLLSQPELRD
ncbi:MAG TPA: CotH kinase family protein, partial [Tepidisphaeraceae bacterium]|nr:CotH kinase family protein [Tepidisphaeraceae bacterium]